MRSLLETLRSLGPGKLAATLAVSAGLLGLLLWSSYRIAAPHDARQATLSLPYAGSPADAGLDGAFAAQDNHLRALESALARSIGSLARIAQARVHLVLPEGKPADSETGIASAAVVIATAGSLPLDRAEVGAIQQLVASAVPGLKPQAISIVDDKGHLLARGDGGADVAAADRSEELRIAYERRLAGAIEDLLAPTLGAGNVRAQVSASLDFDRLTETAETYDPDGQVLRSSRSLEAIENGAGPMAAETAESGPQSERNEETLAYEVSRITRTQVRQGGKLQRLSVAVMVNGSTVAGEDGTPQYRPRSSSEMAQIESLVRAAVGIDESRGDRLDVVNLPFTEAESLQPAPAAPAFAGFGLPELLRLAEILVLGAIALAAIFFVARPLLARHGGALAVTAGGALPHDVQAAAGFDDVAGPRDGAFALGGRFTQAADPGRAAHRVGEIVRAHPEAAATVVRAWLRREV